ncbi:MAG: ABC transporter ATP-binding protein [Candidatus Aenigmatarchaeota archaeon]
MSVLRIENVEKIYDLDSVKVRALNGVSLDIQPGEFVSITGPSGSGKSTMMHMIGCLDRPTRGKVYIDNSDISKLTDDELASIRNKKIGFVFQNFNLIPRLTALENVMLPMWFADTLTDVREKTAREVMKKVGLEHRMNSKPNQLSGGERQRVAIARALANNPSIIVADEPTGNLDSKTGREIMDVLEGLNAEGNTLLIVTHDMSIAERAQRQIRMLDGKICE